MEPRIVEKSEIILIGMVYFGDPSGGEFAKTWELFDRHMSSIPGRVNEREFYGLEFYTEEFQQSHKWYYMAAVETTNLDEIPLEMVGKRLPASKYAVFTVTGGLKNIGSMFGYAYVTWLPSSDYEIAYPYDFEFYDEERFKGGQSEDSEIDLYIPIKEK